MIYSRIQDVVHNPFSENLRELLAPVGGDVEPTYVFQDDFSGSPDGTLLQNTTPDIDTISVSGWSLSSADWKISGGGNTATNTLLNQRHAYITTLTTRFLNVQGGLKFATIPPAGRLFAVSTGSVDTNTGIMAGFISGADASAFSINIMAGRTTVLASKAYPVTQNVEYDVKLVWDSAGTTCTLSIDGVDELSHGTVSPSGALQGMFQYGYLLYCQVGWLQMWEVV